jgi:mannosyltransferase
METHAPLNSRTVFFMIVGMMFFAVLLSLMAFSHQSLRLDEAQSLWQTSHSPLMILQLVGEDVHVPFYHFVLHFWQFLFDNSVETARFLSLILFLISIPVLYKLGALAYNQRVGLFATLLFSISPFMNWYGNEIRMYSLFTLLALINQYCFVRIYKKHESTGAWVGFAVTALLGIFTHYFFFLLLLAQACFFLFYRNLFPQHAFKKFTLIAIILILSILPWIVYVNNLDKIQNQAPILTAPTSINLFSTFSQFLFGFQDDHLNTILVSLWPLTILLGFLALKKTQRINPTTLYFVFALIIPIITVFVISSTLQPLYVNRYLIFTLPSLLLFLAYIFSLYPPRVAKFVKVGFVILILFTLSIEVFSAHTPAKENYREAADYLEEHALPSDVIVVSAPFTVYPIEYYYHGPVQITTLPLWDRYVTGPIPPFDEETLPSEVEKIAGSHARLWLLLSYDQGYENDLHLHFENNYHRLDMVNFSPGLNLYLYQLRYDI